MKKKYNLRKIQNWICMSCPQGQINTRDDYVCTLCKELRLRNVLRTKVSR